MTHRRLHNLVPYVKRLSALCLGIGVLPLALLAQRPVSTAKPAYLKAVDVMEKDGQILSYRYLGGTTEVAMRGTALAPDARIRLKVESRPGFVELDINRGQIFGLKPASQFGKDFLTYVLWAVSVDGKAANLGEITFQADKAISIDVTTPYQTFWLMLTAEPTFAVVDPSPVVVLYSADESHGKAAAEKTAQHIPGELFFYTHYANYDRSSASAPERVPTDLLQARKAVELASKSGILAADSANASSANESEEEKRTREAFKQSKVFLERAEAAFAENSKGTDVPQFSRTAAQIAENARALAQGAVGGVFVSQLERELTKLRGDLANAKVKAPAPVRETPPKPEEQVVTNSVDTPPVQAVPPQAEPPIQDATLGEAVVDLFRKPVTWFGLLGWGVALLLLFRKRSI